MRKLTDHEAEAQIAQKLQANEGLSQREVARLLNMSRARVFQIEKRALRKLRAAWTFTEYEA